MATKLARASLMCTELTNVTVPTVISKQLFREERISEKD